MKRKNHPLCNYSSGIADMYCILIYPMLGFGIFLFLGFGFLTSTVSSMTPCLCLLVGKICQKPQSVQQAFEVSRDWQSWYAKVTTMQLKDREAKMHSGNPTSSHAAGLVHLHVKSGMQDCSSSLSQRFSMETLHLLVWVPLGEKVR